MVRNSLVENRIRFDSDKGPSGGGGMTDEDIDQDLQQDIAAAAVGLRGRDQGGTFDYSPGFDPSDRDVQPLVQATQSVLDRDRQNIGRSEAQRNRSLRSVQDALARIPSVAQALRNVTSPAGTVARQVRSAADYKVSPYAPRESDLGSTAASRFYGDAYQDLYGQNPRGTTLNAVMQGGPVSRLAAAYLNTPSPREQAAMTAGDMFSLARQSGQGMSRKQEAGLIGNNVDGTITNTSPMFDPATGTFSDVPIGGTGGTMSTGFLGAPVYSGRPDPNYVNEDNPAFQRQVRGNFGDERDRGDGEQAVNIFGNSTGVGTGIADESAAAAGAIPSSELALNFLQNPYYAYSGFGNQYNPYGFANNTLVDLLQTRNLTQPAQADTLGLFGNPMDFS